MRKSASDDARRRATLAPVVAPRSAALGARLYETSVERRIDPSARICPQPLGLPSLLRRKVDRSGIQAFHKAGSCIGGKTARFRFQGVGGLRVGGLGCKGLMNLDHVGCRVEGI